MPDTHNPLKDRQASHTYRWDERLILDSQSTKEERMIWDSAHAYAHDRLQPLVIGSCANDQIDPEVFQEMGPMGLLIVTLPEEYGGNTASHISYGLVACKLASRLSFKDVSPPS